MLISMLLALSAQDLPADPARSDLRCLAALSAAVSVVPAEARQSLIAGVMYYVGRLEGRDPAFDLGVQMTALVSEALPPEEVQADLQRCGAEIQARGAALIALGNQLSAAE